MYTVLMVTLLGLPNHVSLQVLLKFILFVDKFVFPIVFGKIMESSLWLLLPILRVWIYLITYLHLPFPQYSSVPLHHVPLVVDVILQPVADSTTL